MADLIDLVDKKKLIRNIHQILDKHINASADYPAELFEIKHELLGSIDIEQSFFTQDSVNRWIPCSERLPEEETYVIAVIDGCSREVFYSDSSFIGSNFYRNADEVTYWMPKPEPPKE